MVHRESELPIEVRAEMRGGKGKVILCHLEQALLPSNGRLFAKLTLAPGCSIGEHAHSAEAEMFYFVQGQGVVTDDGERILVQAGDSMTTPDGHTHSVENTGDEDLVLIAAIVKGT